MKVTRCAKGHFYDGEKFAVCPYCNEPGETVTTAANPTGTIPLMPNIPYPPTDVPNPKTDNDDGVTMTYEEGIEKEVTQSYDWGAHGNGQNTASAGSGGNEPQFVQAARFEPVVGWLVCVEGKERGRDYRLLAGRNYVGRSVDMDVSIPDDQQLSREKHCSIIYDPRSFRFVLLPGDSTLTMVNGAAQNAPCDINDGDIISCGSTKLCLIRFCKEGRDWE